MIFNIFKKQLLDISTVLNNKSDATKLLTSFNALDVAQQKVLLSSKLLTDEQKSQCVTMMTLSSVNTKYTAEQLTRVAGVSAETLANWGLVDSTDSLTVAELTELAVSDKQAKNVLDKIVAQNAQAVANGEVATSNIALASSEGGATLATGAFTTAIKANIKAMWTWMTTTPVGWLTLLVSGVFAAVKAYNALTVSVEEQKEKMEESLSAYEDAKSKLSSITTELETQKQTMDELLAKEKLTYAENGQLEELQAITRELRIQKDLAEKEEERTEKQLAEDASKLFNKQFGDYDISQSAIDEYQTGADISGNNAILVTDENNISAMIAGYKQFNELLDEAYGSGTQYDIDHFESLTEDLKDMIFETAQDLKTQQDNISAYYDTLKDIPYENLITEQKEIVDAYNQISDAIALIYQQLDPNTWNSMQVDNIFATDGIEKTKDELVAMAQSGKLSPETIKGYVNLNKALGETTLSAQDLCDELYAISGTKSYKELVDIFGKDAVDKLSPEDIKIACTISTEEADKAIAEEKAKVDKIQKELENTGLQGLIADYDGAVESSEEYVNSLNDIYKAYNGINNIDRDIIYWNDESLEENKAFLEDMYGSYEDAVNDLKGTWSTVLGSSENIEGVEIAFTQMLQTDQGLVPLTDDTFWNYFNSIFNQSWNEDGTFNAEKFIKLDAEGTDMLINGQMQHVANMIAAAEGQYMNGIKLTADDVVAIGSPAYDEEGNDLLPNNNSIFKGYSMHDVQALALESEYRVEKLGEKCDELGITIQDAWDKDNVVAYTDYASTALDGLIKKHKELESYDEPTVSLGISETVSQLNTQLKPAMDSLADAWGEIFSGENGEIQLDKVDLLSVADSIKSTLDEMNDPEGLNLGVDYSAYEDFIRILEDTDSTQDDVKQGFNALAQSIINAGVSGTEDFETLKDALEDLGVVNNEIVAFDALINNIDALKEAGLDLKKVDIDGEMIDNEDMIDFINKIGISSENATVALTLLQAKQGQVSGAGITTTETCQGLIDIAKTARLGQVELAKLEQIMSLITRRDAAYASGANNMALEIEKEIKRLSNEVLSNVDWEVDYGPLTENAGGAGSDSADAFLEEFEKELEKLQDLRDRGKITEKEYLDQLRVNVIALYCSNTVWKK